MSVKDFIAFRDSTIALDEQIDNYIALADAHTGAFGDAQIGALGTMREWAVALRAMHMYVLDNKISSTSGGKGGFVGSETEAELSRSYKIDNDVLKKYPELSTTIWGMQLIQLIRGTFIGPRSGTMDLVIGSVQTSEIITTKP